MSKIDMKDFALMMTRGFERLLTEYLTLNALLDENGIQLTGAVREKYLADHPYLTRAAHEKVQPLYDAIERSQDLEPALKALLNMSTKGPVQ
jgi:hypothetical protein